MPGPRGAHAIAVRGGGQADALVVGERRRVLAAVERLDRRGPVERVLARPRLLLAARAILPLAPVATLAPARALRLRERRQRSD